MVSLTSDVLGKGVNNLTKVVVVVYSIGRYGDQESTG